MAEIIKKEEAPRVIKKMGRPRKEFDPVLFEKLCALHCTEQEICDSFDMTDKTLEDRIREEYDLTFSEAFRKFKGEGKKSLRRTQWTLAQRSSDMAKFLGKNYLGQTDTPLVDLSRNVTIVYYRESESKRPNYVEGQDPLRSAAVPAGD